MYFVIHVEMNQEMFLRIYNYSTAPRTCVVSTRVFV